jgi:hypothetical protein
MKSLVVWIVDILCYPMGKAIDRLNLSNLTEDED